MDKNILCLSWLNGQIKALAVRNGSVVKAWERLAMVEDFSTFSEVLKEAVSETGYDGKDVALVLSHSRLTQQLVETPPIKGWNLRWFLERRAKQLKTFTTEAVWSYQPALPTKNAKAILLNLFPKPFLDQLVQGCEQAGLHLTKVLPATAVLNGRFKDLSLGDAEVALLAAETAGTTTVLIGRNDGQIYLGHTLNSSWNVYPDRVNVDLNRTLLYVKQQFGAPIDSIWLFGSGAGDHAAGMQSIVKTPVKVIPVPPTPFYWCQEALKLSVGDSNNLVSSELQQAPQRRALLRATAVIIGIVAVVALATAAVFQVLVSDRLRTYNRLQPKVDKLQDGKLQLTQRELELARHKEFVALVSDQSVPAVPGWFLGYLGSAVPEELFLNHLQFKHDEDLWSFQLAGALQRPASTNTSAAALATAVSKFKTALTSGPFHVKITRSSADERPESSASARRTPGLASSQPGRATPLQENQFVLEGVLR